MLRYAIGFFILFFLIVSFGFNGLAAEAAISARVFFFGLLSLFVVLILFSAIAFKRRY